MKKDELDYFERFNKDAEIAFQMSTILKDYIYSFDYNQSETVEKKVHRLEVDADKNMHSILKYLVKDFLPPIEREDIVLLSNKLDDVVDNIDEIVTNLDILDVQIVREDFKEFIKLVYKMCEKQKEMIFKFKYLKKYDQIHEIVIELNRLEGDGDKLYEKAIMNLFITEHNPVEIIKWQKIYESVENFYDSCESVANTVGEIILKNM
ncbi:MAG: DUF47 family protein [Clostridia bacterium]|nr:DUF47 family protein [Clostridia bacterium]